MIRLITLGTIRIDAGEGSGVALTGQQAKRLALLAYLALARPRGPHRRDTIVALLWPELDQDRARAALRQALHSLRRALGQDILVSAGNESLSVDHELVSCDAWELEEAAARGDHQRVLALHDGDLAAGLFVSAAPAFDEWIDGERTRVRSVVRASAWAAADAAVLRGDASDAVQCARRALSLSGLDEAAVRRAIGIAGAVADRSAAVSIYESFADLLQREMDVEPSEATRAVYADVRRVCGSAAVRDSRVPTRPHVRHDDLGVPAPASRGRRWVVRPSQLAAAAGAVLALVAAARLAPSAPSSFDARRVRVEELVNESSLAALDTLARTATLATRSALLRLDNVRVDPSEPSWRSAPLDDEAGTVVRGAARAIGDSVELRVEVVDRTTGSIARAVVQRFPREVATVAATSFADRVSAAVATALYPGWGTALSQPTSYSAYRGFVDGMRNIQREQHDAAMSAFLRAYGEDSTFTAAGILAAMELYQMRRYAAADSFVRAIADRRAMLPAIDGHLLDWLQRSLGGDRIGARAAMEHVVALAPTADIAWLQLAIDNVETARADVALAALDRIDPEGDFGEAWVAYWATRIEALHTARDHGRELAVARAALRRHPELRVLVGYELRALAALGHVAEIERAIGSLVAASASDGFDPRSALRQTAMELAAHGNSAAARRVLGGVDVWYATRPAEERTTLQHRLGSARTSYLLDDRRAAAAAYADLLRDHPKCVDCVGALGVLAARGGDRVGVDSSVTLLEGMRGRFLFGRPLVWKARIAAASGDHPRAAALQSAAFASGTELDVLTHADPELRLIKPDSIYRAFARVGY